MDNDYSARPMLESVPLPPGPWTAVSASINDDGTVSVMMERPATQPPAQPEPEGVPTPISAHDLAIQWNRQADQSEQWDSLELYEQLAWAQARAIAADRARRPTPQPLTSGYIDAEHQGKDLVLLETFYRACNAEGGTADEIHLRGIRAVLATHSTPQPPADGEVGELVKWLKAGAPLSFNECWRPRLTRAAELMGAQQFWLGLAAKELDYYMEQRQHPFSVPPTPETQP